MILKIYSYKNQFVCMSNTKIANDLGNSIEDAINEFFKGGWDWEMDKDDYWSYFVKTTTPIKVINSIDDPEYFI